MRRMLRWPSDIRNQAGFGLKFEKFAQWDRSANDYTRYIRLLYYNFTCYGTSVLAVVQITIFTFLHLRTRTRAEVVWIAGNDLAFPSVSYTYVSFYFSFSFSVFSFRFSLNSSVSSASLSFTRPCTRAPLHPLVSPSRAAFLVNAGKDGARARKKGRAVDTRVAPANCSRFEKRPRERKHNEGRKRHAFHRRMLPFILLLFIFFSFSLHWKA